MQYEQNHCQIRAENKLLQILERVTDCNNCLQNGGTNQANGPQEHTSIFCENQVPNDLELNLTIRNN